MAYIPLLSSTATYSEASQIIGTINSVIQSINTYALIGSNAPTSLRNAVIGGDFGTNPWQRTTSFTGITSTATYTADRFFAVGGASSSISVSRQTGTPVPGFAAHARFGRAAANTDTDAIKFGQVLTNNNSLRFQGQPFVLSFWARAGATFSSTTGMSLAVSTGTGSDESLASYLAGSWTGQASVTLYNQSGIATSGITPTTAFARYAFSGVIPTAATQIGFNFAYTPVGTAGASDYLEFAGVQLEVMPQGGVQPTPFEWRPAPIEKMLCQHYYYRVNEGAAQVKNFLGQANTGTAATILVPYPTPMRTATTTSVAGTTVAVGSFSLTSSSGVTTSSLSSLVITAGSATLESANLTATIASTGLTAGAATFLISNGGAGTISFDSEL